MLPVRARRPSTTSLWTVSFAYSTRAVRQVRTFHSTKCFFNRRDTRSAAQRRQALDDFVAEHHDAMIGRKIADIRRAEAARLHGEPQQTTVTRLQRDLEYFALQLKFKTAVRANRIALREEFREIWTAKQQSQRGFDKRIKQTFSSALLAPT
ncbi:hypothetical protein LTR17_015504 [Elasticomyces elasticus]|nr:hypothetical protein LTR17_015504 [Elasticomyces elasticus]